LDAVQYLADQHHWPLFYSRFFMSFLAPLENGLKEHETAFFWSRCYGMSKKVKHRQFWVSLFILPISLSLGSVYHACQTVAAYPATFKSFA
tara:strand:- start:709 stop:981 length:273 start_codon:yes stop_codon:yes gene_type:complete